MRRHRFLPRSCSEIVSSQYASPCAIVPPPGKENQNSKLSDASQALRRGQLCRGHGQHVLGGPSSCARRTGRWRSRLRACRGVFGFVSRHVTLDASLRSGRAPPVPPERVSQADLILALGLVAENLPRGSRRLAIEILGAHARVWPRLGKVAALDAQKRQAAASIRHDEGLPPRRELREARRRDVALSRDRRPALASLPGATRGCSGHCGARSAFS
eukprot:scaffold13220_cov113-Isochrysis_galbana.AAC.1